MRLFSTQETSIPQQRCCSVSTVGSVGFELLDKWNQPIRIDVKITDEWVEAAVKGQTTGSIERDTFGHWIFEPEGSMSFGGLTWIAEGFGYVGLAVVERVPISWLDQRIINALRRFAQ